MSRRHDIKPGWKMTNDQHGAYWYWVNRVHRLPEFQTKPQAEVREMIHLRAFGCNPSAKEIDHLKMYDDFKAVCLALTQPTNFGAQMRQAEQPLIRLRHGILEKFSEDRIVGLLCSTRFKRHSLADLDDMNEKDLTDLRNTLCARTAGEVEVPAEVTPVELEEMPF
jgi:hypothetical protein